VNAKRHRVGVLILCTALSLGLLAISASAAQATTWMVNGTNVEKDLPVTMPTTTVEKSITLLSTIGSTKFAMSCETVEFVKVVLHAGGLATGEIWWSGCKVSLNGVEAKACKPLETIKLGEKDKAEKEEGKTDQELETIGTIRFGETCAISEELKLTGIYWIEDTSGEWEVEKSAHVVREAEAVALLVGGLKIVNGKNASPAFIDGSLELKLNDEGPQKFSALYF
jgi:hypothetical protein